jgi:hypothetical protein
MTPAGRELEFLAQYHRCGFLICQDLKAFGVADHVAGFCFSEFGRRM